MEVIEALRQRRSVRAFLPEAPPAALVQTLLRESLDEWLARKSSPGFPASVLGL